MGLIWTNVNQAHHSHNHRTHITEQRAPTDESIRLLREMESKARDEVSATVRLDANEPLSAVIHRTDDHFAASTKYCVQFQLGGERHEVIKTITHGDHLEQLQKAVANKLTALIFSEGASAELKKRFFAGT